MCNPQSGVLPRAYGIVPFPEGRLEMSWTTDETGAATVNQESHGNMEGPFSTPKRLGSYRPIGPTAHIHIETRKQFLNVGIGGYEMGGPS